MYKSQACRSKKATVHAKTKQRHWNCYLKPLCYMYICHWKNASVAALITTCSLHQILTEQAILLKQLSCHKHGNVVDKSKQLAVTVPDLSKVAPQSRAAWECPVLPSSYSAGAASRTSSLWDSSALCPHNKPPARTQQNVSFMFIDHGTTEGREGTVTNTKYFMHFSTQSMTFYNK